MKLIDWSKAPEDAEYERSHADGVDFYKRDEEGRWVYWSARGQWERAYGTSEVDCCARPAPWTGEGLPPAGLTVEAYFPGDTMPKWLPTKIMYLSKQTVVYTDGEGLREVVSTRNEFEKLNVSFRPLRNARDKGVDALCDFITGVAGGNDFHRPFWERAYDKGLRAPE